MHIHNWVNGLLTATLTNKCTHPLHQVIPRDGFKPSPGSRSYGLRMAVMHFIYGGK